MEFRFPRTSQGQSTVASNLGQKKFSPWRSIFHRWKNSADTTEALDMQPYLISVPLEQRPMLSYKESHDILKWQHKPPSSASSRASWSPFGTKDQPEGNPSRLTAREVYHQTRVKNSRIAQSSPSRSRTIATHGRRLQISAPVYQPSDTWIESSHSVAQVEPQSLVGPEDASEAVFTLTRHPDPEAKIMVQYSPRTNWRGAAERLADPNHIIAPAQDLAEHDADKRNQIFDRIDMAGWNQIIPKKWIEDKLSDEEEKTSASHSAYSRDTEGSDVAKRPFANTSCDKGWHPDQPRTTTSRLTERSNSRFVFEDVEDEPERTEEKSRSHEDQIWWQKQTDTLQLSSIPLHHSQKCSSDRPPCYIEAVSQLKQAGGSQENRPKGIRYSDEIQKEHLTTRSGKPRTNTSPGRFMQSPSSPSSSARSPTRRTVDEFFNLTNSKSLTPLPLRPRREKSDGHQSHRIHDGGNHETTDVQLSEGCSMMTPGSKHDDPTASDPLAQGEASSSSDNSWETICCVPEEGKDEKPNFNDQAGVHPALKIASNNAGLYSARGQMRPSPSPCRDFSERDLEQKLDDILDLYLTDGHSSFLPRSATDSTKVPDSPYSSGSKANDKVYPEYAHEIVSTPPRYSGSSDAHDKPTSADSQRQNPSSPHVPISHPASEPDGRVTTPARPRRSTTETPRAYEHDYRSEPRPRASKTSHHRHRHRHAYSGDTSTLRQHALFTGDYPQSPGSRRWNGYGNVRGSGDSKRTVHELRASNPGVTLPVTVIDEFGNTWI